MAKNTMKFVHEPIRELYFLKVHELTSWKKMEESTMNCSWTFSWTLFSRSSWTQFMNNKWQKISWTCSWTLLKKFMNWVREQQMAKNTMNLFMNSDEEVHELCPWMTNGRKQHELSLKSSCTTAWKITHPLRNFQEQLIVSFSSSPNMQFNSSKNKTIF